MTEQCARKMTDLELGENFWFTVDGTPVHGSLRRRLDPPAVPTTRVFLEVISPHKKGVPSELGFDLEEVAEDIGVVSIVSKPDSIFLIE